MPKAVDVVVPLLVSSLLLLLLALLLSLSVVPLVLFFISSGKISIAISKVISSSIMIKTIII